MFRTILYAHLGIALLTILLCFFCCLIISAQDNFVISEGGSASEEFLDITYNSQGSILSCGYFSGPGSFSGQAVYNNGNADVIVATYNANVLQWIYTFGGSGADRAVAITSNQNNDVLVTGTYSGTINIEGEVLNSVVNSRDVFVAAFNENGLFLWAKSFGGSGQDEVSAIQCDSQNNIYVTGYFSGAGNFGGQFLTSTINPETSQYTRDIFLTKLNTDGDIQWTKQGIAENDDIAFDLAINQFDQVFIVGRYSGNITFDDFHPGLSNLAGFIAGFSTDGDELYFLRSLGGYLSLNEIEFNTNGNLVLGGTYSNALLFLNEDFNSYNSEYNYNTFICEMTVEQEILWLSDLGSDNELELSNLKISNSNDIYLAGTFKCRFDELSLDYGPGSFNSVGFDDLYMVKYSGNGNKIWQRNVGGRRDETLNGLAIQTDDNPIVCGGYSERMILPYSNDYFYHEGSVMNFNEGVFCPGNTDDCGDTYFRNYLRLNAVGSMDAYLCAPIDLNRSPLYFYHQPVNSCIDYPYPQLELYDMLGVQGNCGAAKIGHTLLSCDESYTAPWLFPSGNGTLYFQPEYVFSYSPEITYTAFNNSANVNQEINVWLNITSADGCFNQTDSIDISLLEPVSKALVSDDEGINFLNANPLPVEVCNDDSVLLTAVSAPGTYVTWSGLNLPPFIGDSLWVTQSDAISINTSNDTCFALSNVTVEMNNIGLPPLGLGIAFKPILFNPIVFAPNEISNSDTIYVCSGSELVYYLYEYEDGQTTYPLFTGANSVLFNFSVDGVTIFNDTLNSDFLVLGFDGTIDISMQAFYDCDGEILTSPMFNSHVVIVVVDPVIPDPVGTLCPGGSLILNVSGYDEFTWTGGNNLFEILSPTSILVSQPGIYQAHSTFYDDLFACSTAGNYTFFINATSLPVVSANPTNRVICPGSSVILTCSGSGTYEWYNTENELLFVGNNFVVENAGFYYCRFTDLNGCTINSNSISIQSYFDPAASLAPFAEICPGISTNIIAEVNQPNLIQWQSPLSGSSLLQNVSEPGIYTFSYSLCGVNSMVSVEVSELIVEAEISGENFICDGDSILLSTNPEMMHYDWLPGSESESEIYIAVDGSYQVQVTDYFGCSGVSDEFLVDLISFNPQFNYSDSLCIGSEFTITAENIENLNWYSDQELSDFIGDGLSQTFVANELLDTLYITDDLEQCDFEPIEIDITLIDNPIAQINPFNGFCEGEETALTSMFNINWDYNWILPNDEMWNSSNLILPNPVEGLYTLIVINEFGCSDTTEIVLDAFELPVIELDVISDIVLCEGDSFILNATGNYSSVLWFRNTQDTGISDDFIEITEDGVYYAMAFSDENCESQSNSIQVDFEQIETYDQLSDEYLCIGDSIEFELLTDDMLNWYINGEFHISGPILTIDNFTGYTEVSYQLISENGCFGDSLSFTIYPASDCAEELANVFSPNNDGINDKFSFDHFGVELDHVMIFDRWGNNIIRIDDLPFVWDGKNADGNDVNESVFYFVVIFKDADFESEYSAGYIQVLR